MMISTKIKAISVLLLGIFISITYVAGRNPNALIISAGDHQYSFNGDFYIYFTPVNPKMALRPSEIENVQYNVITWEGKFKQKEIRQVVRKNEQSGDGFDDRILDGAVQQRTADLFALENKQLIQSISVTRKKDRIEFSYRKNKNFEFSASIKKTSFYGFPELTYRLIPKMKGYYSVVYVGAPVTKMAEADEIWQPMIWQEKRFPDMSYITAAFQCPVPTTFVQSKGVTIGVVAHPGEFPFEPLPLLENSRFAVALRTERGQASPMIMAPVLGGAESLREVNESFSFRALLYVSEKNITNAYEEAACHIYGFRDYRRNDIASLNETFENIVDYSLSSYSWFIDEQKGCAYSTDVPGAVKNVSSLNPLELSIVTDRKEMFEKRAYPIIEYQLSREKFLFSSDSTQKIQSPSRKMAGPIAPISELSALYCTTGKNMPFLMQLAGSEFNKTRIRNLEVEEKGDTWQNALWIFKATGDTQWVKKAQQGADRYLEQRIYQKAMNFSDTDGGGFFFWTGYTPQWIDLLELYEVTGEKKYLEAAHEGARHFTMFTWMSPAIPADSIVVNKNGKAPVYWYLQKKGHTQMSSPEEKVPAWRLSEMGLTPESSGTCSGHRAIFMANYASWMLRIAYYTQDVFLRDVAKAAVIGRYRNFPGYHINTARTTIYEKEDYPLRDHKELSVNSFHYNHIMPKASLLLDYLVTDAWFRSKNAISFPNEFIEGYAYLQSKFYGFADGTFYGNKATLWMPEKLLKTSSIELNYISARSEDRLMLAFCNQSKESVLSDIELNPLKTGFEPDKKYSVRVIADNVEVSGTEMMNGKFPVTVSPNGITGVIIEGVAPIVDLQDKILRKTEAWKHDYFESKDGRVRAMLLNLGDFSRSAYIYLTEDDRTLSSVTFKSADLQLNDDSYPFEFTIPVKAGAEQVKGSIIATGKNGQPINLGDILLRK